MSERKVKTIGITGSMGAGKSTITRLLGQFIPVSDCDAINARLLEPSQEGFEALRKAGLLRLKKDGTVDRQAMADTIFSNPEKKKAVEAILHPLILGKMRQWMRAQDGLCAVEVPLLFEAGLEDEFDAIWTVVCSEKTALHRLEQGRQIPAAEARRRLGTQYPPARKAAGSDEVLTNDGSLNDLDRQIAALLRKYQ